MFPPSPSVGQILGHYRILEQVGAGGMGIVYRAHDERLERDVALKVLPPGVLSEENARRRFRKEALALAKLHHANIATIHDFDTQDDVEFLVMEYVRGMTLAEKLRSGAVAEKEVFALGEQIAKALSCAHEIGIVHRDLKPGNIMITPTGDVKLLDFGISLLLERPSETAQTATTATALKPVGTLPYMAPEQLRGKAVDGRCDIYAAGVILYEMTTGRRPFEYKLPTGLVDDILHKPPAPPQSINPRTAPSLAGIILKCLEKDPNDRYQTAKDLAVDLRRATTSGTLVTPASPVRRAVAAPTSAGMRVRVKQWLAVLAVAIAVTAVVGIGMLMESSLRWGSSAKQPVRARHILWLAVLPLENLSGDPDQEYFVDGMHEELIATLGKIGSLKVISRTSAMQYKSARKPLPQIAKELGVDVVVEGSVRRSGDQVRVTVRLTEAATDRSLWANSYQRELRDTLALQSDVARAIAQEIKIAVTPEEENRLAEAHPVSPEAHDAYLKGRYYWNKRTTKDLEKALGYFQQALEIDPHYALAYAGLADCYYVAAARDFLSPKEAYREAEAAAKRALLLNDLLAEAHASLGGVSASNHDWLDAEREFRRAIELNPSYATAHHWYSIYLAAMGRHEEAVAEGRRALELDPFSLIINEAVGWPFYLARQYDQAIEQYQRTLQMDPNFPPTYVDLGRAYLHKGLVEEAIRVHLKLDSLSAGHPTARAELGHTYAVAGRKGAALKILNELRELSKQRYVSPYDIARIYVGLAEKDLALKWLEKASEERDDSVVNIKVDPDLDPLTSEPRFHELIRRLKFPPSA